MPTLVRIDGWEHGRRPLAADNTDPDDLDRGLLASVTGESATALTVESGAARTGGFGLRIDFTAAAREVRYYAVTATEINVFCGYIRFPSSLPAADLILFYTPVNSGVGTNLRFNASTSKFEVSCGGGSFVAGTHTVVADQWYRIEIRINLGANNSADWKVALDDGAAVDQTQATSTQAATDSRYSSFGDGGQGAVTAIVHYDDWVWSQTSGDFPIGPVQVHGATISQSAEAEHQSITTTQWQYTDDFSGFTDFAGQTETDSRSRIDDLNTTDGIRLNAAGSVAGTGRWKMDGASHPLTRTLYAVQALVAVREATADVTDLTIQMPLSGIGVSEIWTGDIAAATAAWKFARMIFTTRPGGGAWEPGDVDSLRFELASTDATPNLWVGGAVYEGAYGPVIVAPESARQVQTMPSQGLSF